MSTTAPMNGDPDYRQWRQTQSQNTFSPSSSGSPTSPTTTTPSTPSLPEFAISPKTSRKLSLQTYLATQPEWSSSTRLVSLYSEFDKLKETNPFGYEANVNWWRAVILGAARNGFLSTYQPVTSSPHYPITSSYSSKDLGSSSSGVTSSKPIYESTGSAIGVLELDLEQLGIKFRKNGRRPHSLQAVMNEMTVMGEVVPRSEFLPWAGVGWTGWVFHKVVKAPLLWSLKQLSISDSSSSPRYTASPTLSSTGLGSPGGVGSGGNGNIGVGGGASTGTILSSGNGLGLSSNSGSHIYRDTFVIIPFIQEAATRILKLQQETAGYNTSDNLMTFEDFRQRFSRTALLPIRGKHYIEDAGSVIILTDRDLELLIRYMQFDLKVLISGKLDPSKYDNEVIKFATKETIRNKSKQEITTADRGIIELRETCKRLDKQVQDIEERISELNEKARSCVRKNQRSQATFALRQRKTLEDVLNKRLKSLDTISTILFKIQSSETDAEVLQSYKLGADTLASVMSTKDQQGEQILSTDNVDNTMDRLADVFADQQEVDQAMSDGTEILLQNNVSGIDEDDLIAELDAMMDKDQKGPSSPIISPSSIPSSPREQIIQHSASGKRFAELPEETFAKQRKVSQSTVHSQRKSSCDVEQIESQISSPLPEPTRELGKMAEEDSDETEKTRPLSRMETDQTSHAVPIDLPRSPQYPTSKSSEVLTSQEEQELGAILNELESINAPDVDILMQVEEQAQNPSSSLEDKKSPQEESKPRKEARVIQYS
ncbi:hypothetical protein BGZ76_011363 [Entomortierella beljakovae]|nr:hypothetical protein BGZ76_011363 [Entomortierella beljakovae]